MILEYVYLFKWENDTNVENIIPYSDNLPIKQLSNKLIPTDLSNQNFINFFGDLKLKAEAENKIKTISYESTIHSDIKNLVYYAVYINSQKNILNIYYKDQVLSRALSINLNLTQFNHNNIPVGFNTKSYLPSYIIELLSGEDYLKSTEFYDNLLKLHIKNIEAKKCEYTDYYITTRKSINGYWFELNTSVIGKGTSLYIYKTNATPQIGFPVKKQGYC